MAYTQTTERTSFASLNDLVKVKLTDLGRDLVKQGCRVVADADENGYTEMHLHEFMRCIGPHIPEGAGWIGTRALAPVASVDLIFIKREARKVDRGDIEEYRAQISGARWRRAERLRQQSLEG
jgi:hypothetical protein